MKFCYNTKFSLPKHSQRSRSILQDGSTSLGLFWNEKTPSYNRRNTVHSNGLLWGFSVIHHECKYLLVLHLSVFLFVMFSTLDHEETYQIILSVMIT